MLSKGPKFFLRVIRPTQKPEQLHLMIEMPDADDFSIFAEILQADRHEANEELLKLKERDADILKAKGFNIDQGGREATFIWGPEGGDIVMIVSRPAYAADELRLMFNMPTGHEISAKIFSLHTDNIDDRGEPILR